MVLKLAYVLQDRADVVHAVKCLTRHMKEPRNRLKRYLTKNKRCVLTCPQQTSDASMQVRGEVPETCSEESARRGDYQARQTLAETRVVFANACRISKRRSWVLRP